MRTVRNDGDTRDTLTVVISRWPTNQLMWLYNMVRSLIPLTTSSMIKSHRNNVASIVTTGPQSIVMSISQLYLRHETWQLRPSWSVSKISLLLETLLLLVTKSTRWPFGRCQAAISCWDQHCKLPVNGSVLAVPISSWYISTGLSVSRSLPFQVTHTVQI